MTCLFGEFEGKITTQKPRFRSLYWVCLFKECDAVLRSCSIFEGMWPNPVHSTGRSGDQTSIPPHERLGVCRVAVPSIPLGVASKDQDLRGSIKGLDCVRLTTSGF